MGQKLHRVYRGWWNGNGLVFPNAATAGVPPGTSLTTLSASTTAAAVGGLNAGWSYSSSTQTLTVNASPPGGAVVDSLVIPGLVLVNTTNGASVVTISRCRIINSVGGASSNCISLNGALASVTITQCQLRGGNNSSQRVNLAIQDHNGLIGTGIISFCDISWHRTGISYGSPGIITGNYIHDSGYVGGDHTNGMLCPVAPLSPAGPGAVLTISNNTVWCDRSETDSIMLNPNSSSNDIGNTTVSGNLLGGGSFSFYGGNFGGNSTTYITVTGNYFSTRYYLNGGNFGTHSQYQSTEPTNTWANNTWYDGPLAGQLIAA